MNPLGTPRVRFGIFWLHAQQVPIVKRIYDEYPRFSKRDEVLYMLGLLSARTGETEKATRYYRSVIDEFPESKFAKLAQQRIEKE